VMPRSGSDYVWTSRIFHPVVGFAWSLVYMFSVFYTAYVGEIGSFSYAFSTILSVLGLINSSPSLTSLGNFLSSASGTFLLGIAFTLFFGAFSIFGSRFTKGLLYSSWIMAGVGIALMWFILGSTNQSSFVAKWNALIGSAYSNGTYQALYSSATSNNWPGMASGFGAIITALPLASLFLLGGNYVNAFSGEIKGIRKSIPIALFLSLVFGIIYWSVTATLTLNVVSAQWITAVGRAWDVYGVSTQAYPLPLPPSQPLILAIAAYPNRALIYFMFFAYLYGSLCAAFTYFWISSKYFFAWSFDRLLPSSFARVSDRFHTPYVSIVAMVILGIGLSASYSYLGWSSAFTLGTVLWDVSYVVPSLALVAFPFVKKELFEQAPGWIKAKVGSVPLVSIIGAITAVLFAAQGYIAYSNPLITSPTLFSFEVVVALIALSIALYFGAVAYHKRHGLNILANFREIPPE